MEKVLILSKRVPTPLIRGAVMKKVLILARRVLTPLIGEPILQKSAYIVEARPTTCRPPHVGHFLGPSCKEFTSGRELFGGSILFGIFGPSSAGRGLAAPQKGFRRSTWRVGAAEIASGVARGGVWCPKMLEE